jgi:hypothetical protein
VSRLDGRPPDRTEGGPRQGPPPKVAPLTSSTTASIADRVDVVTALHDVAWRLRGRRLCPHRRPWPAATIAELSAALGSLKAAYAQLDTGRRQRQSATRALDSRRKRDFDAGLYALDGHLTQDKAFRRFIVEGRGRPDRLPTPEEYAASWPEPEYDPPTPEEYAASWPEPEVCR